MMVVPVETPVTIPVTEPMVATEVLVLLHVPPANPSLNVTTEPGHIDVVPVIGGTEPINTVLVTIAEPQLLVTE